MTPIALLLALLAAGPLPQQSDPCETSMLQGTVYDVSGRPLAAAAVTIRDGRGVLDRVRTDSFGRFRVCGLPVRRGLNISAEAAGTAAATSLTLAARATSEVDLQLEDRVGARATYSGASGWSADGVGAGSDERGATGWSADGVGAGSDERGATGWSAPHGRRVLATTHPGREPVSDRSVGEGWSRIPEPESRAVTMVRSSDAGFTLDPGEDPLWSASLSRILDRTPGAEAVVISADPEPLVTERLRQERPVVAGYLPEATGGLSGGRTAAPRRYVERRSIYDIVGVPTPALRRVGPEPLAVAEAGPPSGAEATPASVAAATSAYGIASPSSAAPAESATRSSATAEVTTRSSTTAEVATRSSTTAEVAASSRASRAAESDLPQAYRTPRQADVGAGLDPSPVARGPFAQAGYRIILADRMAIYFSAGTPIYLRYSPAQNACTLEYDYGLDGHRSEPLGDGSALIAPTWGRIGLRPAGVGRVRVDLSGVAIPGCRVPAGVTLVRFGQGWSMQD